MTRRRLLVLPVCAVAAAAIAAVPVAAKPPKLAPRIGAGVTAGGVDVAGLTVLQAAQQIKQTTTPALQQDTILGVAGKPFRLAAATAQIHPDATLTAKRALNRKVPGDVPLVVEHSEAAVAAFAADVARQVHRAPRDAAMHITLRRVRLTHSRTGRGLDAAAAARRVDAALDDPAATRVLHQRLRTLRPAVTVAGLRRRNGGTVITVDKAHFTLRLFKHLEVVKTYPVAVGQPAYPTPSGLFAIQDKQVNPTWSVPNSPWAGELQGTTVEGGSAANPLKARWMGIADGVGIHGTGEDASIGSAASHGCVRMHVADVIALYPRVPVGTPVLLA